MVFGEIPFAGWPERLNVKILTSCKNMDPLSEALFDTKRVGKIISRSKIEFNAKKVDKIQGLDELSPLLFPGNRKHQKIFIAIFIELKYADRGFLSYLKPLCEKYEFSPRMLETVRSKMKRMGLIDHVSRFSRSHGYKDGWVLSTRFSHSMTRLAELARGFKDKKDPLQEHKDHDLFRYL
jgi:hypothetical protein